MLTYKFCKEYDSYTGELIGVQIEERIPRCDWSGETWEYPRERPREHYQFHYAGSDPCWGVGSESEILDEDVIETLQAINLSRPVPDFGIKMSDLLYPKRKRGDYVFKETLSDLAIQHFKESDYTRFSGFLRAMRVRTAYRLVRDGEVELYQLPGFTPPPEEMTWEEFQELKSELE